MDESSKSFLDKISPDRRRFVQRLVGMAGFAVPAVRTFVMGAAIATIAPDVYATSSAVTTTLPLHSVRTTLGTTSRPTLPAAPSQLPSIVRKDGQLLPHPVIVTPGRKK